MKCFGVLLFMLLLAFHLKITPVTSACLQESDYWNSYKEDCVKELNLDINRIKDLDKEEIAVEDDQEFNKFAQCFFLKSGIQDVNGVVKYNQIRVMLESKIEQSFGTNNSVNRELVKKIARDAVNQCESNPPVANSPGQLAVKVGNCIMKNLKRAGGG